MTGQHPKCSSARTRGGLTSGNPALTPALDSGLGNSASQRDGHDLIETRKARLSLLVRMGTKGRIYTMSQDAGFPRSARRLPLPPPSLHLQQRNPVYPCSSSTTPASPLSPTPQPPQSHRVRQRRPSSAALRGQPRAGRGGPGERAGRGSSRGGPGAGSGRAGSGSGRALAGGGSAGHPAAAAALNGRAGG